MNSSNSLTLALDVMGGDKGPLVTIPSAIMAVNHLPNLHLILCGDENIITTELARLNISSQDLEQHNQLSIFSTTQVV
ncbi:MAG: phosphate acyltransferase, partial [Colwellia sp.]|nr:phosphate acyltransferase [Colwellia sp.]